MSENVQQGKIEPRVDFYQGGPHSVANVVGGDLLVKTGGGTLNRFLLQDSTAIVQVTFRDGVDVGGAVLFTALVPTDAPVDFRFSTPLAFGTGLFVDVTGANSFGLVEYN